MKIDFKIKLSDKLYLKDPDGSEIGKMIIKKSIELINEIGYEDFTFKKLAKTIPTTEATVYRYFENKHKLLIFLVDWYWAYIRCLVLFNINNLKNPEQKIKKIIDLLVWEDNSESFSTEYDHMALYYIAIAQGSKTYLSKNVDTNNKEMLFTPYKELSELISTIFQDYNPDYNYCNSLASSIIEISHFQYYFMHHLPRLCDFGEKKDPKQIEMFLENLIFGALKK